MTVPSEVDRSGPYNGNGITTIFNYGFRILNESHLSVIKTVAGVDAILTLDTDYIVSDVGASGGGQIACVVAPATGSTITILRNVPFVQETDLENQGAYYAETVEDALDLGVMRDQQLKERLDRAITIPPSADPSDLDELIEDILRLSESADNIDIVAGIAPEVATVAGIASEVVTVAGVADQVTTVAAIAPAVVAVAAIDDDVSTVAAIASNVVTVSDIAPAVVATAGIDDEIETVAGIAPQVVIAANNVADITNFSDVYQGGKAADPLTRNDGSALQVGDLYFNTATRLMLAYDGSAWVASTALPSTASRYIRRNDLGTAYEALTAQQSANIDELRDVNPDTAGKAILAASLAADVRNYLDTPVYVDTLAALKALDTTKDREVRLTLAGRAGVFVWTAGNFATLAALDTQEGLYVKANAIANATGMWVRQRTDLKGNLLWFGAVDGADCKDALQCIINMRSFCTMYAPYGTFKSSVPITADGAGPVIIEGEHRSYSIITFTTPETHGFRFGATTPISKLVVKNICVTTDAVHLTTGTCLYARFDASSIEGDAYIEDNAFMGNVANSGTAQWKKCVHLVDPVLSSVRNNYIVGANAAYWTEALITPRTSYGIHVESAQLSIINFIENNTVLGAAYGISVNSTGTPGLEGLYIWHNNCVHCVYGIVAQSDGVSGYHPYQNSILNNHCEFFKVGIYAITLNDVWINDNLLIGDAQGVAGTDSVLCVSCNRATTNNNNYVDASGLGGHATMIGVRHTDCTASSAFHNKGNPRDVMVAFTGTTSNSEAGFNINERAGIKDFANVGSNASTNNRRKVNRLSSGITGVGTLTAIIPADDTVPLISEGTLITQQVFTPTDPTNVNRITFEGQVGASALTAVTMALFKGSTCIFATCQTIDAGRVAHLKFTYEDVGGGTRGTALDYTVRVGPDNATTLTLNGSGGARRYGGVSKINMSVEEILAS